MSSVGGLSQDLFHRFAFGDLVDEFVEIADRLHRRLFDIFDSDTADDAFNFRAEGIEFRCISEEGLEVRLRLEMRIQFLLAVPGEPAGDFINLCLGAALSLYLRDVEGIHSRDAHREDAVFFHMVSVADSGKGSRIILRFKFVVTDILIAAAIKIPRPRLAVSPAGETSLRPSILCRVYQNIKTERFRAPFLFW